MSEVEKYKTELQAKYEEHDRERWNPYDSGYCAGLDFADCISEPVISMLEAEVERLTTRCRMWHENFAKAEAEVERLKEEIRGLRSHQAQVKRAEYAEAEVERLTWMLDYLCSDYWGPDWQESKRLDIEAAARRWEEWYNKTDKEESLG